ncbi:MAG: hypothetical protein ACI97K_001282 [Glaciecola sp.]|jgi:uncharacterized protein (DUF885 family)
MERKMKSYKSLSILSATIAALVSLSACSEPPARSQAPTKEAIDSELSQSSATSLAPSEALSALYNNAANIVFSHRQLSASSMGVPSEIIGNEISSQMEDYSPAAEAKLRIDLANIGMQIQNYPSEGLSVTDLENKQVMASIVRYFSGDPNFDIGYIDTWMGLSPFVINQINGPIFDAARNLQDGHQINNLKDAQNYLIRLANFDSLLESVKEKYLADADKGWLPPKDIQIAVVSYLEKYTQADPKSHPLVTTFEEKLNSLENLPLMAKKEMLETAANEVKMRVYPAYEGLSKTIKNSMESARSEAGIWAQPNGAEYYKDAIKQLGDSDLSADDIHQIGLDEVARINAEMNKILIEQGYENGTVGERMVALSKDPQFLYEDSDEGRAKLLNDLNGLIQEITEKMDPLFKTKPKYEVEVRSFPVESQDSMPGGQYSQPPIDGSKPGIYWINLRDMEAVASFTLKTLTYHEANPGHHWQISLSLAQDSLPFMQRIAPYNAFIEGWALYSEQIAFEMGLYNNDPFGNLGRLQDEMFRAVRLVVDTGLHYKKWPRQQAIDYMMDKTGTPFSSSKAEIERYMVWPGQALGYKLGMLKILELREKAKMALGADFDLAVFHDEILTGGAVPMLVLEAKIDRWIKQSKKAS